jgi:hypothetical protein
MRRALRSAGSLFKTIKTLRRFKAGYLTLIASFLVIFVAKALGSHIVSRALWCRATLRLFSKALPEPRNTTSSPIPPGRSLAGKECGYADVLILPANNLQSGAGRKRTYRENST